MMLRLEQGGGFRARFSLEAETAPSCPPHPPALSLRLNACTRFGS